MRVKDANNYIKQFFSWDPVIVICPFADTGIETEQPPSKQIACEPRSMSLDRGQHSVCTS